MSAAEDLDMAAAHTAFARRLRSIASSCVTLAAAVERWAAAHALARAILVVDDSPPALAALVAILAPLGVPVHAATDDEGAAECIRALGAVVHVVSSWDDVPDVWREVRACVVVVDLHLGDALGLEVLHAIGRGPRGVIVTSCCGVRTSIVEAVDLTQAVLLERTDVGEWADRLRALVLSSLTTEPP